MGARFPEKELKKSVIRAMYLYYCHCFQGSYPNFIGTILLRKQSIQYAQLGEKMTIVYTSFG